MKKSQFLCSRNIWFFWCFYWQLLTKFLVVEDLYVAISHNRKRSKGRKKMLEGCMRPAGRTLAMSDVYQTNPGQNVPLLKRSVDTDRKIIMYFHLFSRLISFITFKYNNFTQFVFTFHFHLSLAHLLMFICGMGNFDICLLDKENLKLNFLKRSQRAPISNTIPMCQCVS